MLRDFIPSYDKCRLIFKGEKKKEERIERNKRKRERKKEKKIY